MTMKYYAFLDVVLDVFYSIILYNAFIAFPGFNLFAILMAFSVFIMINYWWIARSFTSLPKYHLVDFYFTVVIMFIFSQWANYYKSMQSFLVVLTLFWALDSLYELVIYVIHRQRNFKKTIRFDLLFEIALVVVYGSFIPFLRNVTPLNIALIVTPYLIFYFFSLKMGYMTYKFLDNGNQPY